MSNDCAVGSGWVGGVGGGGDSRRWRPRPQKKARPVAASAESAALHRALERASDRSRAARLEGTYRDVLIRMTVGEQAAFVARLGEALARSRVCATRLGLSLGLSRSTVGTYLQGAATPKAGTLRRMADALGCSADWLAAASRDPKWQREPTPPKSPKPRPPRLPKPTDTIVKGMRPSALFALRLREAIDRSGLTVSAFSASLGFTNQAVYCTGQRSVTRRKVAEFAEALGCSKEWLALTSDEPGWLRPAVGRQSPLSVRERRAIERIRAAAEGK